jgi:hypothetical protein
MLAFSVAFVISCDDDDSITNPSAIDTTEPSVVITAAPEASPAHHQVGLRFTATDDQALDRILVTWGTPDTPPDVVPASGTSHSATCVHTYETVGQFTVVVRAVDASGNEASQSHLIVISEPLPNPPGDLVLTLDGNRLLVEWTPGAWATSQEVILTRPDGLEPDRVRSFADNDQEVTAFSDLAWGADYEVSIAAINAAGRAESAPVAIQVLTPDPPVLTRFSSAADDATCVVLEWESEGPVDIAFHLYRLAIEGDMAGDSFEAYRPGSATDARFCWGAYPIRDGITYTARVFGIVGNTEFASEPLAFTVDFDPVLTATGIWYGEYISMIPGPHDGFFRVPTELTLELFETEGVISGVWAQEDWRYLAGSLSGTRTGGHLELVLEHAEYDDRLLSADFAGPHLIEASLDNGGWVDTMVLTRQ